MHQQKSTFQPVAATLTVLAAFLRLVPHPPNFAPVGSVALFGGARLRGWQAYLVPILAMLVTDPILSHLAGAPAYSSMTPVIYGCFLLNVLLGRLLIGESDRPVRIGAVVLLGRLLIGESDRPVRIGAVALLGSLQFYLITNFFVWLHAVTFYPRTTAGLLSCYAAALPFFGRTMMSDLFYSGVLFGAYALLRNWEPGQTSRRAIA